MKMRRDFVEGRFEALEADSAAWLDSFEQAGKAYEAQFAFGRMGWGNFQTLVQPAYRDAVRIARDSRVLTPRPLRQWRWRVDPEQQGEAAGWWKADLDDRQWKTTDVGVETWSSLRHHNYFGAMWYRAVAEVPQPTPGKKVYLWLAGTDGSAKVFINGKHIPFVDAGGQPSDAFSGFCQPASFDITGAVRSGGNHIAILCTRSELNEIGTGGLLGPALIYAEK